MEAGTLRLHYCAVPRGELLRASENGDRSWKLCTIYGAIASLEIGPFRAPYALLVY